MAILFADGFEAGLHEERWTRNGLASTPGTAEGRLGGYGIAVGDGVVSGGNSYLRYVELGAGATTIGWSGAIYIDTDAPSNGDIAATNVIANAVQVVWATGHQIGIQDFESGTDYFSTSGAFVPNTWHWVEVEGFFSATVGTLKVWLNGALVIDESGLTTVSIPVGGWTIQIGGVTGAWIDDVFYDDIIVTDDTGSYNNTMPLGDHTIKPLFPDGDGNVIGLTGSDGNQVDNALLVDDREPNTATYVESNVEGDKDLYTHDNLTDTSSAILAIQVEHYAQKSDAGGKFGRTVLRTNSTDYPQASVGLVADPSWGLHQVLLEENPNTSAAWTPTQVNAIEAGFEVRDS